MREEARHSDRNETDVVADLQKLCEELGFIYSLCLMAARCLWMSTDEVADVNWIERPNQAELSLLLGLIVKHPIRLDAVPSEESILEQVQQATDVLRELHLLLSSPTLPGTTRDAGAQDQLDGILPKYEAWMNSGEGMVEPIFYGGEGAYDFQFLEMASKRYVADERWLKEHKGAQH